MHEDSPFYLFHPDSIGWFHRRHKAGEEITKSDLVRLLRADATNGSDPLLQYYLVEALDGRLPKRRGRKPRSYGRQALLMVASLEIHDRAAEIRSARQRGEVKRLRGDVEPCVQAADEIGPLMGLPGGRSLINAISSFKTAGISMNEGRCRA